MAEEYNAEGFDDSAEYSPKSEFSKPRVVMETVEKCINARGKEMRRGYFNSQLNKDGLAIRTWMEDTRKVYISCVTALRQLLVPEILDDENYKALTGDDGKLIDEKKEHPLKIIDKDVKQAEVDYSYFVYIKKESGNLIKFEKTGESYMPDIDSTVSIKKIFPDGNECLIDIFGAWNHKINLYWDKIVKLNDDLFEELMRVIHRKNYFKQSINY